MAKIQHVGVLVSFLASAVLPSAALGAPPRYTMTIVGPASPASLPGGAIVSFPMGMNNNARIVGYESTSTGVPRALSWRGGVSQALVSLENYERTYAARVNIRGEIVGAGYSTNAAGNITQARALLWIGNNLTDLGGLGGPRSAALAINDDRTVVGYADVAGQSRVGAWIWRANTLSELPALTGATEVYPYDLSNTGFVVGTAAGGGVSRPWIYAGGATSELPLPAGTRTGAAYAVNNVGVAVGGYESNRIRGEFTASRWEGGVRTDLGSLGSWWKWSMASDVNASGQIVGNSSLEDTMTGFLWQGGTMYDLRTLLEPGAPSTEILSANGINDSGQIAATVRIDTRQYAVLLTPVPAPGAGALLLAAGALAARRRR